MSTTFVSSHANLPIRRDGNPSLYTDVNGKEWIIIFGASMSYLYDLSNDKYQIFIDLHQKWTSVADGKDHSIIQDEFFALYEHSHVVDNNRNIMYVCDSRDEGNILVFDIKDLPNKKYRLLDVIDTSDVDGFTGEYQMFVIGDNLHFLFAAIAWFGGYEAQHCKYNSKSKKFTVIDENFEEKYLSNLDFTMLVPKTKEEKQAFINNLKIGSEIDVLKDVDYYHATIKHIVDAKDKSKWNKMHDDINDKLRINKYESNVEKDCARFGYIHFTGLSSTQDQWTVLSGNSMCHCKNQCINDSHQFSMPLTQCSFRRLGTKGTTVIYSKRYDIFIIAGRDKGLFCCKHVNRNWCDYHDNIDFSINGKQSYYKGNKTDKSIKKHYFSLIVNGYLRNCNYNYGVDIPIDLYDIVLKYYDKSSDDDEWMFFKNDKMPLSYNCACVLVNDERDIIIIGNSDTQQGLLCKIYRFNIDQNEIVEIQEIEMVKPIDQVKGVYSKQTNRIYLFDRQQGTEVISIDVQQLLRLSEK